MLQPDNEILFQQSSQDKNGRNLDLYYAVIEEVGKGYIGYDSNSLTFWKRQNYLDSEKIARSWWWGQRMVATDVQAEPKDLLGSYTLYDSVMMDICHYVFIKIYRVCTTSSTSHMETGLWVKMMRILL